MLSLYHKKATGGTYESAITAYTDGVRDIYSLECEKKNVLEQRLHQRLKTYGYHDIQTPSFEYFDVFSQEVGTIPSRELFKFFDREGRDAVLRPVLTPLHRAFRRQVLYG